MGIIIIWDIIMDNNNNNNKDKDKDMLLAYLIPCLILDL